MVKLYSISVTNVLDGVASACRVCALVSQNSQRAGSACVPCPAGFYIDRDTNRCQECPPNTHLAGRHTYGQDACVPCGPGSISNKVIQVTNILLVHSSSQVHRQESVFVSFCGS